MTPVVCEDERLAEPQSSDGPVVRFSHAEHVSEVNEESGGPAWWIDVLGWE
jgi:hypothetical protein